MRIEVHLFYIEIMTFNIIDMDFISISFSIINEVKRESKGHVRLVKGS